MKKIHPQSLVQIHYHDRVGGVGQVMGYYARGFDGVNIIICQSERRMPSLEGVKVTAIDECGYHQFRSLAAFETMRDLLIRRIAAILDDPMLPKPVAVLGHNLTLGKNPALSAAFVALSVKLGSPDDTGTYRFFSVLHDFAEQGRIDMVASLRKLQESGVPVGSLLYGAGAPLLFSSPGRFSCRVLKRSGCRAVYLPNPVVREPIGESLSSGARHDLQRALQKQARQASTRLDFSMPTYSYPSRMIPRKNVLETLLLGCCLLRGNVLLGPVEKTHDGRRRSELIKGLCARYRLPVLVNAPDSIREAGIAWGIASRATSAALYMFCDAGLSTSVAEGFGYALFEPWLYRKPLIGRKPAGFSYPSGGDDSMLYSRLPVPCAWISRTDFIRSYDDALVRYDGCCTAAHRHFGERVWERATADECIDFGCLDESMQEQVAIRVLESKTGQQDWITLLKSRMHGWPGLSEIQSVSPASIELNRTIIEKQLSLAAFSARFKKLLNTVPGFLPEDIDFAVPGKIFCCPGQFRLLMTPVKKSHKSS